jgi:hypothetical protein
MRCDLRGIKGRESADLQFSEDNRRAFLPKAEGLT